MKTTTAVKHISSPESEAMINSFLRTHPQGVLTTISKQGLLNGSVINVFELDNYQLAFMTKKSTRKFVNLQSNPTVSFVTYDALSRTELEVQGIAQAVHDKVEQADVLTLIKNDAKNGRWHTSPYVSVEDDYALFMIYPRKMHMTTYWERSVGMEAFHESIEFDLSMRP
ncbi:MAG TPA: pyridoxamine 5'-phosphate oxidase family protein [Candidatus Microsaccharimonas sp.]|jgi:pyridoxine/pyridoxamine 5'-phosphate oxidase